MPKAIRFRPDIPTRKMSMDSSLSPEPPSIQIKGKGRKMKLLSATILTLLLAFTLLLLLIPTHATKFAWLTAAEFNQLARPAPLTRLKYKLMNLTPPALKSYWKNRPVTLIDSIIWSIPTGVEPKLEMGTTFATNSVGTRACLLSPSELNAFMKGFGKIPQLHVMARPRIQCSDDARAQLFVGDVIPYNGTAPRPSGGQTVNITPKIIGHSIRLVAGITSTGLAARPSGGWPTIVTNFNVFFVAPIPHNGALLLEAGKAIDDPRQTSWILILPKVIDSKTSPLPPFTLTR